MSADMSGGLMGAPAIAGAKRSRNAFDPDNAGTGRALAVRGNRMEPHRYPEPGESDILNSFPGEYDAAMHAAAASAMMPDTTSLMHMPTGEPTDHHHHSAVLPEMPMEHVQEVSEGAVFESRPDTRTRYSLEDRMFMCQVLEECGGNQTEAVRRLRAHPGFEKVTTRTIRRYKDSSTLTQRVTGIRPHNEFEKDVFNALVAESQSDGSGVGREINYSYSNIRKMAQTIAALPQWAADPRVQACAFSNTWISGFLKRHGPATETQVNEASA